MPPMTVEKLGKVAASLLREHARERGRLDTIKSYVDNRADTIYVPRAANSEFRQLIDQARFNVLPLVVSALAQKLFIDGFRPARSSQNLPVWDLVWQPNRMDARQAGIWRAAITYGKSFVTVMPGAVRKMKVRNAEGVEEDRDVKVPVLTPHSPRHVTAIYDDEVNDEWPRYAMVCRTPVYEAARPWSDPLAAPVQTDGASIEIFDENYRYRMVRRGGGWAVESAAEEHGLGVVPVVRFLDLTDTEEPPGKIEPLLPAQRQLNQATFGLLMAQQYAAFRQRWVTGMAIPVDESGAAVEPWNAAVNRVWHAESPDTKFGDFAESNLAGYLDSRDKTLFFIANVAQVPPHNLVVGEGISNISAEALVAIQDGHQHDVAEHQTGFGESAEQMLRLAGLAMGDESVWSDYSSQVAWRDTTPRSLGQVADALGKLAVSLGIPARALWEKVPGVTDQDLLRWEALASEQGLLDELKTIIDAGDEPSPTPQLASV